MKKHTRAPRTHDTGPASASSSTSGSASALGSPFAALAGLRDALPPASAQPEPSEPGPDQPPPPSRGPARAVIRIERKGRGGKEATRIEKLGLSADDLGHWCSALKKSLGCGGTVEGDTIVLHGDLRQRLAPLLTARGVRKITMG